MENKGGAIHLNRTFGIEDFSLAARLGSITTEDSVLINKLSNKKTIIMRLQALEIKNREQAITNHLNNSLQTIPTTHKFKWTLQAHWNKPSPLSTWRPSTYEWGKWLNAELKYIWESPRNFSYIFETIEEQYLFIESPLGLPMHIRKIHLWSDKPPTFTLIDDRRCIHTKDMWVLNCQTNTWAVSDKQ